MENIFNLGGEIKLSGVKDFKVDVWVDKKFVCLMSIFFGVV